MFTVNCPACDAQYQLDEAKVGPAGRKLKCAKCGHLWVAMKPVVEVAAGAVAEQAPEVQAREGQAEKRAEDVLPAVEKVEEQAPEPAAVDLGAAAEVGQRGWLAWFYGPNLWRMLGWGLILAGLLAGGWVVWHAWQEHDDLGKHQEAAVEDVPLLAMEEPVVIPPPQGVVLQGVRAEFIGEGDGVVLAVRGQVKNVGDAAVTLPQLQVELLGRDGKVADVWPVRLANHQLLPAVSLGWEVSFTNPPLKELAGWRAVFVK